MNEMLDASVIMEVHEATPWINSFVIVETVKDGKKKLQICLDAIPLNKAIMHESYITVIDFSLRSHFGNLSWMRKAVT